MAKGDQDEYRGGPTEWGEPSVEIPSEPEVEPSAEQAESAVREKRADVLSDAEKRTSDLAERTDPAWAREHIGAPLEPGEAGELGQVREEAQEAKTELVEAVAEKKGPPPITPEMKEEFEAEEREADAKMEKSRQQYAEATAKLRQYEGATGKVLGFLRGNDRKMYEFMRDSAKEDYEKARGERVGGEALKFLEEKGKLADKIAEERSKEKGWLSKVYDVNKKFGEINASKWSKWPKGDKWQKVGKMLSVRTGISLGLLAGGTAMTLGGAQVAAAGTMVMRRVLGGGFAAAGSYDLMRMVADRSASDISIKDLAKEKGLDKKQMKEMKPEQVAALQKEAAAKLEDDELLDKLDKIELQAMMGGKKTADNAVYQLLQAEVGRRFGAPEKKAEGEPKTKLEALKANLAEGMKDADKRMEEMKKKRARNDMIMKGVAGAIGVAVASGTVAKGFRLASEKLAVGEKLAVAKEFYFGKEAAAATVSEPMPTVTAAGEVIPPKEIIQPPEFSKETLAAATVQRGEGYTHVIARQLESRPQDFGFDPAKDGDVSKWAAKMSRQIAKDNAIIGKNGEWRLQYDPNNPSAIVLEKDASGFHLKEMGVEKRYKPFAAAVDAEAGDRQRRMDAAIERVRQSVVADEAAEPAAESAELRPDLESPPDVPRVDVGVEAPVEAEVAVENTAVAPAVEVDRGAVEDAMRTIRYKSDLPAADVQRLAERYVSEPDFGKNYSLTHIVQGETYLKKGMTKDALMQIINDPQQGYDENRSAQWALKQMGIETGIRGGDVASVAAPEVVKEAVEAAPDGRVGSIETRGIETRFQYDAAGNVTGVYMDGESPGLAQRAESMLSDGWVRLVREKALDASMDITMVEGDVRNIRLDLDAYDALVNAGKASSPEAKFLLQSVDTKMAMLKQQYGEGLFRGAAAVEPVAERAPDVVRTAGPVYTENQMKIAAGLKGGDPAELRRIADAPAIESGRVIEIHSADGRLIGKFGDGTDLKRAARLALQQMGHEAGVDAAHPPVEEVLEQNAPKPPVEAATGVKGFENGKLPFEQRVNALGSMVGEGKKTINGIQFERVDGELRVRIPEDHMATPFRGTKVGFVEVTPQNIEAITTYMKMPAANRDFFILSDDKLAFNTESTRAVNAGTAANEVLSDKKWLSGLNAMRREMANRRLQMLFGQTRALGALQGAGMGDSALANDLAGRIRALRGLINEEYGGGKTVTK